MAKRRKPGRPAREPKTRTGEVKTLPVVIRVAESTLTKARTAYFVCLEAIRDGRADEDDAHTVANGVQMAFVLREHADGEPEAIDELNIAIAGGLAAVRRMYARHERLGKWGLNGDEYVQIETALGYADDFIAVCSRREIRDAARAIEGYNDKGIKIEDAHKFLKGVAA